MSKQAYIFPGFERVKIIRQPNQYCGRSRTVSIYVRLNLIRFKTYVNINYMANIMFSIIPVNNK